MIKQITPTMTVTVTSAEITSGQDTGMPIAELKPGQSVAYQLDATAQQYYKYRKHHAITLMDGTKHMREYVDIQCEDEVLTLIIRNTGHCPHNKDPWRAKATLFFDPKAHAPTPPHPGGLDPAVMNKGGGGN